MALWLEAAQSGYVTTVEVLLDNGADPGRDTKTLLYAASEHGYDQIVKRLLDVSARSDNNMPLVRAANDQYEHRNFKLLGHGTDVQETVRPCGTALHNASARGHMAIPEVLHESGADANAEGGPFGTALIAASAAGHEHVAQLRVNHGANINARHTYNNANAEQFAGLGGSWGIASMLRWRSEGLKVEARQNDTVPKAALAEGHKSASRAGKKRKAAVRDHERITPELDFEVPEEVFKRLNGLMDKIDKRIERAFQARGST